MLSPVTPDWRPYGDLRLCFWKFLIVVVRTPMTFGKNAVFRLPVTPASLFMAFCASSLASLILPWRPYRVRTASLRRPKPTIRRPERRPWRSYCVLIATIVVLRAQ
ncbi:hypothetical protein DPMN_112035 [Dreissena polymorpha]|uniref:Uncharacterized protein n=1 Tax=Dreissena polymorpha TaxID=45954 RepID=A0A9D4KFC8_DREPO|nr:hypothetical protein DPMN_112035 [Dreissena polymorpha]